MVENAQEFRISDPAEMIALGEKISKELQAGSVLALCGGLGAGKTHFTKGVAIGLGCDGEVTSPTFSLAHEYAGGRLPLFHFDFYRMDSESEVLRIGWDEYLDEAGVVVVEWPDRFPDLLPADTIWLRFETSAGETTDRIVRQVSSKDLAQ